MKWLKKLFRRKSLNKDWTELTKKDIKLLKKIQPDLHYNKITGIIEGDFHIEDGWYGNRAYPEHKPVERTFHIVADMHQKPYPTVMEIGDEIDKMAWITRKPIRYYGKELNKCLRLELFDFVDLNFQTFIGAIAEFFEMALRKYHNEQTNQERRSAENSQRCKSCSFVDDSQKE